MRAISLLLSFGVLSISTFSVSAQEESAPPALVLQDHAELSRELAGLAAEHANLVRIERLGASRAGRAIEAVRLAGSGAAEDPSRPAILLVANLDGARVHASAVALHHARRLAQDYAGDERVRALLDSTTVYVVPRANPDAAEARFATPRVEQHASGPGIDDDRDGRQGEDPPSDVDGDGEIAWLRVRDPDGRWKEDPTEPRALVEADPVKGEHGVFRLWPEGRDLDGDEAVAEDAPLDARVDRNFPAGWEPHTGAGGAFATDEPEARTLCEFVLAHRELALVVVYDCQDSLVAELKGVGDDAPRVKRIPPAGVLESDAKLLNELGKRYRKATEGAAKTTASDAGTFARWCYEQRGLLVLSTALWDIPIEEAKKEKKGEGAKEEEHAEDEKKGEARKEPAATPPSGTEPEASKDDEKAGDKKEEDKKDEDKKDEDKKGDKKDDEPKPSDDAKRLRWMDAAGADEAWRFLPWKAFQHPELGEVEIGGFAPYARLEPPAAEGAALAERHFTWFLTLGELLPRVTIAECTRERLGENVHRVKAVVQNDAYLPLLSRSGRRTETALPARVRLRIPDAGTRLAGRALELLSDLPGSGGRKEYTWLVQGPQAMEIAVTVETAHAGSVTRTAEELPR